MGWGSWFGGTSGRTNRRLAEWRRAWNAAAPEPDPAARQTLREALEGLALPDEEIELERDMLDGLDRAAALAAQIETAGLPILETGHRIVGSERCHFSAPASMPDEAAQPGGRVLLTAGRALFVGGGTTIALAWHAAGEALQSDRDLLLASADGHRLFRFRCNTFGDALCGALLARRLIAAARRKL